MLGGEYGAIARRHPCWGVSMGKHDTVHPCIYILHKIHVPVLYHVHCMLQIRLPQTEGLNSIGSCMVCIQCTKTDYHDLSTFIHNNMIVWSSECF